MAADALISALTIVPLAIIVEVTVPVSVVYTPLVTVLALPERVAVIVPALKLPEASRATIADAVLADVAVVAELDTLLAVEIVDNLLSAIEPASIAFVTVLVSVVLTTFANVNPCAVVVFSICSLASR